MKSYVYEILHKPTNSVYVGSRKSEELESIQKYSGSSTEELFSDEMIRNNPDDYQKTIFKTFNTIEGAYEYENGDKGLIKRYMDEYGDKCFNKCYIKDGHLNFSMLGKTHSDETKSKMSQKALEVDRSYLLGNKISKNRKHIHKIVNCKKIVKKVLESKLDDYLKNGWSVGYGSRPATSKSLQGNKHAVGNTNNRGKIYVHRNIDNIRERKMINLSELDAYLSNGWCKGMGKTGNPSWNSKLNSTNQSTP